MKNLMKMLSLPLLLALVMVSCTASSRVTDQKASDLSIYDTRWSLKKMVINGDAKKISTKAFIRFDKEKNSAGGNGSCNSFGSNVQIENEKLSFSNIFSTKMYCEAVQATEDGFLSLLGMTDRFEVRGNNLRLYSGKDLLLEFEAEK